MTKIEIGWLSKTVVYYTIVYYIKYPEMNYRFLRNTPLKRYNISTETKTTRKSS